MATTHSNCGEGSRIFCDQLLAAMQSVDPTVYRVEKTTCAFAATGSNQFAHLYHKNRNSLATLYIRGEEQSSFSPLSNGAEVELREKLARPSGWDNAKKWPKEFPYLIHLQEGTSSQEVAELILNRSAPLAVPKRISKKNVRHPQRMNDVEVTEGKLRTILSTQYERNRDLREQCLKIHGFRCAACDLLMSRRYGPIADNFIHVHHIERLADTGERVVDPARDLIPLCPNCHAVAHLATPPMTIAEIRLCFSSSPAG